MYAEGVKEKLCRMVGGGTSVRKAAKKLKVNYATALNWNRMLNGKKTETDKTVAKKTEPTGCNYHQPFEDGFTWISKKEMETMKAIIAESVIREKIRQDLTS